MSQDPAPKKTVVTPEDYERKSPIENDYTIMKKINDDRFGEVALIEDKQNHQQVLMVREKLNTSQKETESDIIQAKQRIKLNHPSLQKMLDFSCTSQRDFCSKFYKVRGFYEYRSNDLGREIVSRKKALEHFNSEELTNLLYQSVFGLKHLQDHGINFADLRPSHISFDNENNEYKLLDRLKNTSPAFEANLNNIVVGKKLYCSP